MIAHHKRFIAAISQIIEPKTYTQASKKMNGIGRMLCRLNSKHLRKTILELSLFYLQLSIALIIKGFIKSNINLMAL